MGLLGYFKGRRNDEDGLSAMRGGDAPSTLAGESEVMKAGGLGEINVADDIPNLEVALEAIEGNPWLKMFGLDDRIIEAIKAGNVQIEQMPTQTIDLRGTGAREQVMGVLAQHGIDPQAGGQAGGQAINVSGNAEMQEQIFSVLKQFGVDPTPHDPND